MHTHSTLVALEMRNTDSVTQWKVTRCPRNYSMHHKNFKSQEVNPNTNPNPDITNMYRGHGPKQILLVFYQNWVSYLVISVTHCPIGDNTYLTSVGDFCWSCITKSVKMSSLALRVFSLHVLACRRWRKRTKNEHCRLKNICTPRGHSVKQGTRWWNWGTN